MTISPNPAKRFKNGFGIRVKVDIGFRRYENKVSQERHVMFESSLKVKIVKNRVENMPIQPDLYIFLPKHYLITLKKCIIHSMWHAELMYSKYTQKVEKSKHPPLARFPYRHLDRDVPFPKKDVPDHDPGNVCEERNI